MPNDTYTVKLDLDSGGFNQKLAEVRRQISDAVTMASQGISSSLSAINQNVSYAAALVSNSVTNAGNMAIHGASAITGAIGTGANMLASDLSRIQFSTTAPSMMANGPTGQKMFPDMTGWGAIRSSFEAATGFSYSTQMAMTPGAFAAQATDRVSSTALPTGFAAAGTLIGQAAGGALAAPFGLAPVGAFVGGIIGNKVGEATYTAFSSTLGYDFANQQQVRDFVRETSWRFASGRISPDQATEAAINISQLHRAPGLMGQRLGANDVQSMMREFTEVGGYDFVRTAEEYVARTKFLVDNHQKVQQMLQLTGRETALAMRMGVDSGRAADLSGFARAAGYTGSEMLSFATQQAQIGTQLGYSFNTGIMSAANMLANVQGMVANGSISMQEMLRFGGAQSMAARLSEMGMAFAQSPMGTAVMGAQMSLAPGAVAGLNASQTIMQAARNLQGVGPQGLVDFQGSLQERAANTSPAIWSMMQGMSILGDPVFTMGLLKPNQASFRTVMQSRYPDLTITDIDEVWKNITQGPMSVAATGAREEAARREAQINSLPGVLPRFVDRFAAGTAEFFGLPAIGRTLSRGTNALENTWRKFGWWMEEQFLPEHPQRIEVPNLAVMSAQGLVNAFGRSRPTANFGDIDKEFAENVLNAITLPTEGPAKWHSMNPETFGFSDIASIRRLGARIGAGDTAAIEEGYRASKYGGLLVNQLTRSQSIIQSQQLGAAVNEFAKIMETPEEMRKTDEFLSKMIGYPTKDPNELSIKNTFIKLATASLTGNVENLTAGLTTQFSANQAIAASKIYSVIADSSLSRIWGGALSGAGTGKPFGALAGAIANTPIVNDVWMTMLGLKDESSEAGDIRKMQTIYTQQAQDMIRRAGGNTAAIQNQFSLDMNNSLFVTNRLLARIADAYTSAGVKIAPSENPKKDWIDDVKALFPSHKQN